jgi:adenine specific DNA methylase Mod
MSKEEQKFYNTLKDIFIGAKIEGESGYVNLMRIKSKYFEKIQECLKRDIEKKLKNHPKFREELFDKLYSFFNRYFTESGSIYFDKTSFASNVYEKVYTDEKDVSLFWKTHPLYYVKSDRIFNSVPIEFDGYKFYFDATETEHKKAFEKRDLVYELEKVKPDKTIVFKVFYTEKGRKTKINEIQKELKKKGIKINEDILNRAFKLFERQAEVDYFINKNAKEFLKEQFKLWLHNFIFTEEGEFSKERIDQLQILKDIAFKIIDFVSQFEDELLKIWKKPKFVLNSNYVITLDRIEKQKGGIKVIEKIFKHKNWKEQVKEWKDLGILEKEPKVLFENTLEGKKLKPEYRFLPIDTKYFKDLEIEILKLFDNLDQSLDGWLIKSENWQALNTILPKFREKIQTIYIDPPFNKEQEADYFYSVKYKDATWITMLENRLKLARDLLNEKGSIFVRCDYNGNMYVRLLMNEIFGEENFRNEIILQRLKYAKGAKEIFLNKTESLFLYSKSEKFIPNEVKRMKIKYLIAKEILKEVSSLLKLDNNKTEELLNEIFWFNSVHLPGEKESLARRVFGINLLPPKGRRWAFSQESLDKAAAANRLRLVCKKCGYKHYQGIWKKCPICGNEKDVLLQIYDIWDSLTTNWTDIESYSITYNFPTENSEILLKRVIESTSNEGDLVMDFFLGSGTTTATAHKLKRKWIGIEMGEHFYTIVLPRMKKVLAYDPTQISKLPDIKEKYNKNNAGGFFKYYELEQYEDTLRKAKYEDSTLFEIPGESPYSQYVFMKDKKLLDALEADLKENKVKVNLSNLYPNIDIAETLSNLLGKYIKKITENEVEFEDGEKVNIKNLDYKIIKPLIWW